MSVTESAPGPSSPDVAGSKPRRPWRPDHRLLPALGPVTAAALRHGVGGEPPPDDPEAWRNEATVLLGHRLPAAGLAAADAAGVPVPPEVRDALAGAHRVQALLTLAVNALGAQVVAMLEENHIRSVVTKGPGIARLYPSPNERTSGDLDLLVARRDFDRALQLLRLRGFDENVHMQAHEYFNRFCREGINLVRADQTSVDLHHTVPPWYWGRRLSFDEVWSRSHRVDVGGGLVRVANPVHNLLVSALHVVSDKSQPGGSLRAWRDVLVLASGCEPAVVAEEARRVGLDWWLAFVIADLPPFAHRDELLGQLDAGTRPTRPDRFRLAVLLRPSEAERPLGAMIARLPTPNGLAFLAGEAVPSRPSIEAKLGPGHGYLAWWSQGVRRLWHEERIRR